MGEYAVCSHDKRRLLDLSLFADQKERTVAVQRLSVSGNTRHQTSHATL
jgi:hypothetical protein